MWLNISEDISDSGSNLPYSIHSGLSTVLKALVNDWIFYLTNASPKGFFPTVTSLKNSGSLVLLSTR